MSQLHVLPVPPAVLGEGPLWDGETSRLHWIDILQKQRFSCAFDGTAVDMRPLPETPGSFALRSSGGVLMAYRRRMSLVDAGGAEQDLDVPGFDVEKERFNDGACDSLGRFWVGTIDRRLQDPVGGLFRLDPDLSFHKMAEGIVLSNGLTWSPDNRLMYHCDSGPRLIYAYDFDLDSGTVGERRVFARFDADMGQPDGCAIDAEGHLWVAAPHTGSIICFAPDGRIYRRLEVPSRMPSSLVFGGANLSTMFVTSMHPHDGTEAGESDGRIFAIDAGVPGVAQSHFAG
jgi:sugar lactone lactonase YvrE